MSLKFESIGMKAVAETTLLFLHPTVTCYFLLNFHACNIIILIASLFYRHVLC